MLTSTSSVEFAPAATKELQIAYRRYTLSAEASCAMPCTLAVIHSVSLCKEVYAPLLNQLRTAQGDAYSFDYRNHGDSYMVNRGLIDQDYTTKDVFADSVRDLFSLVDTLELAKRRPLIGIGHSGGASGMLLAEIMRPNTFDAIVAIDPILTTVDPRNVQQGDTSPTDTYAIIAQMAANRRATWKNRDKARASLFEHGMYTGWCPQAIDAFLDHGLCDLEDGTGVTLKCPPSQEAHTFMSGIAYPYEVFRRLPEIRVPVLFIGAENSEFNSPESIQAFAMQCKHKEFAVLPQLRHMLPHEDPKAVADVIDRFLQRIRTTINPVTARI
ncbi:Alpha/Beta hydrolase protein [Thamnocephalis sphaerospora]|uniref:Alpha/Beta hydrolase protein n=1 Tax=Thamnocephalis sphaerospora TaxID=78915 RepID=A0A4V1IWW0_9FUNG|nr:Alpha/Beta hydrolase protein [Thamnocephalis sphaerospora]|eukprot:RKP08929.1 Alpha/Beta hydrolase protein [Thamnocephalis sphaerospora]